jgi:hypothetical protein
MSKGTRELLARFRELSSALKAAEATAATLESGNERDAFRRIAGSLQLTLHLAGLEVLAQGIHRPEDIVPCLEVVLVMTGYDQRDGDSQFDDFDGGGCVAIVSLMEAFIDWRQKSSKVTKGDAG